MVYLHHSVLVFSQYILGANSTYFSGHKERLVNQNNERAKYLFWVMLSGVTFHVAKKHDS